VTKTRTRVLPRGCVARGDLGDQSAGGAAGAHLVDLGVGGVLGDQLPDPWPHGPPVAQDVPHELPGDPVVDTGGVVPVTGY
jgi:hypothetical protein